MKMKELCSFELLGSITPAKKHLIVKDLNPQLHRKIPQISHRFLSPCTLCPTKNLEVSKFVKAVPIPMSRSAAITVRAVYSCAVILHVWRFSVFHLL
jgi:hypothetical protein